MRQGASTDEPHDTPAPKPRAPIGPGEPICWPIYNDEHAQRMLAEVTEWVDWTRWRFALDHRTIPDCWTKHGPLVEELSALYTAWQTAYTGTDGTALTADTRNCPETAK